MNLIPIIIFCCLLAIPLAVILVFSGVETTKSGEVTVPLELAISIVVIGALVSASLIVVKIHYQIPPTGHTSLKKVLVSAVAFVTAVVLYLFLTVGIVFAGCGLG